MNLFSFDSWETYGRYPGAEATVDVIVPKLDLWDFCDSYGSTYL